MNGLSKHQTDVLKNQLSRKNIRWRELNGREYAYLEGAFVIAEANRIFGFDGWSRQTIDCKPIYTKGGNNQYHACYIAHVRITVLTEGRSIIREGTGSGEATSAMPGQAHEQASKAAETDATKRAFVTFGNKFGLSLYRTPPDKQHRLSILPNTTQVQANKAALRCKDAQTKKLEGKLHQLINQAPNSNLEECLPTSSSKIPLKNNTIKQKRLLQTNYAPFAPQTRSLAKIDKSKLTFSEPVRLRNKEHIKFVAKQSCLICGKNRAQAHHLKYMQAGAMQLKVSDEFTVPLCSKHHQELHMSGNEKSWWGSYKINPEIIAAKLWSITSAKPN